MLDRLWNDDKHKRIVPTGGATGHQAMRIGSMSISGGFAGPYFENGPFQHGDVLAGFDYNPAGQVEGNFNFQFAFFVAFPQDGPARGAPVAECIHHLHDYVSEQVLPRFEAL